MVFSQVNAGTSTEAAARRAFEPFENEVLTP
jgi:hypothetical protein